MGLTKTRDQIRKPPSYMLKLLLRKQAKVGRPDSTGNEAQCLAQGGLSGRNLGRVSTVRTGQGNLIITETTNAASVGYDVSPTKRIARPRVNHSGAERNRKTTHPLMVGKLTDSLPRCRKCRLHSVLPAYDLTNRCENCFAEDQERWHGKSMNLNLIHTVK